MSVMNINNGILYTYLTLDAYMCYTTLMHMCHQIFGELGKFGKFAYKY